MIGTPGPFPVIESDGHGNVDAPIQAPRRRYSCEGYSTCLSLACALNWDNFTCRGCCGDINQALLWQAHHAKRKDKVASKLCSIPELMALEASDDSKVVAIGGKRS